MNLLFKMLYICRGQNFVRMQKMLQLQYSSIRRKIFLEDEIPLHLAVFQITYFFLQLTRS